MLPVALIKKIAAQLIAMREFDKTISAHNYRRPDDDGCRSVPCATPAFAQELRIPDMEKPPGYFLWPPPYDPTPMLNMIRPDPFVGRLRGGRDICSRWTMNGVARLKNDGLKRQERREREFEVGGRHGALRLQDRKVAAAKQFCSCCIAPLGKPKSSSRSRGGVAPRWRGAVNIVGAPGNLKGRRAGRRSRWRVNCSAWT